MESENYLSEEEQYKKILNKDEIKKIKDPELRELRQKYWELRLKKVLDTTGIKTDEQLQEEMDKIFEAEQQELNEYRNK